MCLLWQVVLGHQAQTRSFRLSLAHRFTLGFLWGNLAWVCPWFAINQSFNIDGFTQNPNPVNHLANHSVFSGRFPVSCSDSAECTCIASTHGLPRNGGHLRLLVLRNQRVSQYSTRTAFSRMSSSTLRTIMIILGCVYHSYTLLVRS